MTASTTAAVAAGTSLAGTTISAMTSSGGYSVACGIETANWTKYIPEKPEAYNNGGLIKSPPIDILPGVKEAMVRVDFCRWLIHRYKYGSRIRK